MYTHKYLRLFCQIGTKFEALSKRVCNEFIWCFSGLIQIYIGSLDVDDAATPVLVEPVGDVWELRKYMYESR